MEPAQVQRGKKGRNKWKKSSQTSPEGSLSQGSLSPRGSPPRPALPCTFLANVNEDRRRTVDSVQMLLASQPPGSTHTGVQSSQRFQQEAAEELWGGCEDHAEEKPGNRQQDSQPAVPQLASRSKVAQTVEHPKPQQLQKEALTAEVELLKKTIQRANEASHTHLSRIRELEAHLQQKELDGPQTLQRVQMLEGLLQQQQESQRVLEAGLALQTHENQKLKAAMLQAHVESQSQGDLEAFLAMQMEENCGLKSAMVQTQAEMKRQQLQWQEKMQQLQQAHGQLANTLLERLHNLEEQLLKIKAEKMAF